MKHICPNNIKCTIAAFLATLMWRRPLNSTVLAAVTHKGLKEVFDGMGAQVGVQVTNKCKVQMIRNSLYNVKSSYRKKEEREREYVK